MSGCTVSKNIKFGQIDRKRETMKHAVEHHIQGVHKVRVHFKKFIALFLCTIEIICKKDLKEVNRYFVMFC